MALLDPTATQRSDGTDLAAETAPRLAIAHLVDSRPDFYEIRRPLVEAEVAGLDWLRQEFAWFAAERPGEGQSALALLESEPIHSDAQVREFARRVARFNADALVVHLPIWADPIFSLKLARLTELPTLLLGNLRPETSSIVGVLGAGGALDQVGLAHRRVFVTEDEASRRPALAFLRAAAVRRQLRGQTLGLFGGRSLGIFTTSADPAQWLELFGVDLEYVDQLDIRLAAEELPADRVRAHTDWLAARLGAVRFDGGFGPLQFERQVRSYLATRLLAERFGFDFVGVKCQPELSDGYVTQCVAHLLCNSRLDADGERPLLVHACESDADGALTMQLLHLLSGGRPAALLDVRWFDQQRGNWVLANCGAVPPGLCAVDGDLSGLAQLNMEPHVFGRGGGGALPGILPEQPVTLARLCRKNGEYWMAILPGQVLPASPQDLRQVTPAFPKALVRCAAGLDFLQTFGSNHLHMVHGDLVQELEAFCELVGIPARLWR